MARAIAGIEFPLRVGNGFSKLKGGVDGQSSVQPRSGMGCLKLVLSNEGIGVRRSVQGNKNHFHFGCIKRLNAAWSSISCSPSAVSSETPPAGSEESGTVEVSTPAGLRPSDGPSLEDRVEMVIFNCRFLTLMAVVGSLAGSLVCFLKGGVYVIESFKEWFSSFLQHHGTGKVILLLVEALDVYLMGTVMLIFGMGVYGLFVSNIEVPSENSSGQVSGTVYGSSFFGLFRMQERPNWINIKSLEELKAKLGHVIVMVLLVGMFDKSKKVPINTSLDLVCFAASILFSAGCLYLLSKLHSDPSNKVATIPCEITRMTA